MSAPRKVRKNQSVRIRPMQSLTSSIEPTIALQEVTNVMKPVEGTYQGRNASEGVEPRNTQHYRGRRFSLYGRQHEG